jgi:hypothetical protein
MKYSTRIAAALALVAGTVVLAQTPTSKPVLVTPDNFDRAETDMYFGVRVKEVGIDKLGHFREVIPVENQPVVRANRDTLYSTGVFDLDAGPVTITMPDAGKRFMSMLLI